MRNQAIQSMMEQLATSMRESLPPREVPEMDLFLLVRFAMLGVKYTLCEDAPTDEHRQQARDDLRAVYAAIREGFADDNVKDNPEQHGVIMAAAIVTEIINSRYPEMHGAEGGDDD